jgi:hypothetical protein
MFHPTVSRTANLPLPLRRMAPNAARVLAGNANWSLNFNSSNNANSGAKSLCGTSGQEPKHLGFMHWRGTTTLHA